MTASLALLAAVAQAAAESPRVVARFAAPEARQGVAVGPTRFYAIDNSSIAAYDKRTGKRLNTWKGDPALFPHLNSCSVVGPDLVCASSNYPAVPHASSVELFDAATLRHKRSYSLGPGVGSLTWIARRDGAWWAAFANYDGRGGEPGRDHRWTTLVRMDDAFRRTAAWLFPPTVLAAFAPYSNAGGDWGPDGLLYVTGHDRREVYRLRLPAAGATLVHLGTVPISTAGQAIAFDPARKGLLWSIDRSRREVVATRLLGG
ncbi:MAG: hypothetical protein AVDCRST_MAG91-1571 [uncultured Sphingomonadaceae bacterium]|uniref:Uncharacterized protein n=1 Tax=uncultured Sphingomonadaceae bacterium TaxID=169976 RepID=A0A6J4SZQ8_9SPHN|nr:MAG: hypothetical protein AVDCRST_MAG91-1571 [uncultured Sphingomonadaceae bacterium]